MSKETLTKSIREIPDFPIPGILFYDVTTLFKEPTALQELSDILYEMYKDKGITKVVGIESRGFIMGPILATRLGAGFVPIRKPGKLPAETIEESYDKEYGKDTVQMHKDAINEDDVVLLHDDLLATGGTMEAACKLVKQMNPKKVYVNFMARMCLEMMWKWRLCCRFSHFIFHHRLHRLTQIIYPPQNTVLSKRNLR